MDFALSPEQELLKKEARHFLDTECPKKLVTEIEQSDLGYSPELWKKIADLGWLGLVFPDKYGGVGGNLLDLAVLLEEFGKTAMPNPMFSTIVLGALTLMDAGTEKQKDDILPGVVNGDTLLTMALTEPEADYDPASLTTTATGDAEGYTIDGVKLFVPNAHTADYMLVVARTGKPDANGDGITVFIVPGKSKGISVTPLSTTAGDRLFEVRFDKVAVPKSSVLGKPNQGWPIINNSLVRATALQCALTVGVMQQELSMTASYTSTRIQFGRPIGSFQAVQHRLADMLLDVEGARWTSYRAVYRVGLGEDASREVAIAKAWTSNACQRVAYAAQHLHGGIGMDMDYDLHFYFRWAKVMELNLGSAPYHLQGLEPVVME